MIGFNLPYINGVNNDSILIVKVVILILCVRLVVQLCTIKINFVPVCYIYHYYYYNFSIQKYLFQTI